MLILIVSGLGCLQQSQGTHRSHPDTGAGGLGRAIGGCTGAPPLCLWTTGLKFKGPKMEFEGKAVTEC